MCGVEKLIFCNLDMLKTSFDPDDYSDYDFSGYDYEQLKSKQELFLAKISELAQDANNRVIFYSRKKISLDTYEKIYYEQGYVNFKFCQRELVERVVKINKDKNKYFVFIGAKNADFLLAVQVRSLFIVPRWLPLEDKPEKYGIHVDTVKQLRKFIQTLNNQNTWYSKLKIDDRTTAFSLMDARYGKYANNDEEREMISNFQKLLKEDKSHTYRRILLYHFLAGMTNTMEFDDIELFGMIPSSNCHLNQYVYNFMTEVRLLKGKQLPKRYTADIPIEATNLLIRHSMKKQAHIGRTAQQRAMLRGSDEFATLCINPDYKKRIEKLRIEGRLNVLIFDDYMTHGNSFNAVRNLLESLGANKIIFVSLGLFRNPFQKCDYIVSGNVYAKGYSAQLSSVESLDNYEINNDAKEEVKELHEIFHS